MSLYVVATPIGNLKDITYRAVEILKRVQFILAEDTRHTRKLLKAYDIKTQLVSYREQNHEQMITKIKEKLDKGFSLALVSDAGTPGISDPGYKLVSELLSEEYNVIGIPGPSAVVMALSISGLPTDKFVFLGFLPKSKVKRRKLLEKYMDLECTVILYESPTRLMQLLEEIELVDDKRLVCVASELTKLHEKVITKVVVDVRAELEKKAKQNDGAMLKGEHVVLIGKSGVVLG